VTVAVCWIPTPPALADTVFDSATVEVNEPVATPLPSVEPGCVTEFPLPETAIWTGMFGTGFPWASRTVTVIVDDPLPAWNDSGFAETRDSEALGAPTVAVAVNSTGDP
jgi:hypothetical protein